MARRLGVLIAGIYLAAFAIGTDVVGVGSLLTSIEAEFGVSDTTAQWVINAYAIAFAMGVVTGGRLGDMFGRRRVLMIGLAIFAIGSAINAASPTLPILIASRVVQGIGNALLWPTALGLLFVSVPQARTGLFVGLMMGMVGLGNVIGPVLGGAVCELGDRGWRLFFVFNVASGVACIALLGASSSPDRPDRSGADRARLDVAGITTLALASLSLLYALDRATTNGWGDRVVLGSLALASVMVIAFRFVERRATSPIVPPRLWRDRPFVAAVLLNGLQIVSAFSMMVFVPQIGRTVWGLSSLESGALLLPFVTLFGLVATPAGVLYDRIGPRPVMWIGYGAVSAACAWMLLVSPERGPWIWLMPAQVMLGVGVGLTVGPSGTAAVASVHESDAATAGGISFQWHLFAGAFGIAVATYFIAGDVNHRVAAVAGAADSSIGAAELRLAHALLINASDVESLAARVPAADIDALHEAVRVGTLEGYRRSFAVNLVLAIGGMLLAFMLPPRASTDGARA